MDDIAAGDVAALAPPSVVDGLPLLGSVAHEEREKFLGPLAEVAEPAIKRAKEAAGEPERVCAFISARPNEYALQGAWMI